MTQQLPLQGGHLDHLMLPSQKAHSVFPDLFKCGQNGHFLYLLVRGLDLLLREQQLALQAGHLRHLQLLAMLLAVHQAHHLGPRRRVLSSCRLQLPLQALDLSLQ